MGTSADRVTSGSSLLETTDVQPRRLRADAAANLDRVLEAAREVFAEHGMNAPMDEVAQRAGVGIGTVYRRFASKDDLLSTLVNELLADIISTGERHLAKAGATSLASYLVDACELLALSRGTVGRLWAGHASAALIEHSRRVHQQLINAARDVNRPDLTGEDLAAILWAIYGIIDVAPADDSRAWRRHLDFVLTGLTGLTGQPTPGSACR